MILAILLIAALLIGFAAGYFCAGPIKRTLERAKFRRGLAEIGNAIEKLG